MTTIRRLMAIVAAVAIVLGLRSAWRWREVAREYSDRAAVFSWYDSISTKAEQQERHLSIAYEESERQFRSQVTAWVPSPTSHKIGLHAGAADLHARQAAHFLRLRAKHEAAAARPWLTLEPDPPIPK